MKDMRSPDMRTLAKLGAEARMKELKTEIAGILKVFPNLERANGKANGHTAQAKRKRKLSPAHLKAMIEGRKRYYAELRAVKEGGRAKRPSSRS